VGKWLMVVYASDFADLKQFTNSKNKHQKSAYSKNNQIHKLNLANEDISRILIWSEKTMDSNKYFNHFVGAFVAVFLLTSGAVSIAQATETTAVEPTVDKSLVPVDCSQLYIFVENRPFSIPPGSWFWKEARNYLASVGLPHDSFHVKMFEEAFKAEYSNIGGKNLSHRVAYDMTPVFQKPGLGDVAYDYCSRS